MSFIDTIRLIAIALSIVVIIAGFGLLLLSPEQLEGIFDKKELPEIDFYTLERSDKPNSYLLCSHDKCPNAKPDGTAPVFNASLEETRARLLELVDRTADIKAHRIDMENQQFDFIERTPMMRFPDVITVQLFPSSDTETEMAIYSRSIYGHSDFGKNKKRVEFWIAAMTPSS